MASGTLYIVSTPIGNLEDITFRAIKILKEVDIIVCEDTRVSKKLLNHFNISKKLISYNKFNETEKTSYVISLLQTGHNIALISDAGTPIISDPGYVLIRECKKYDIKIQAIGGLCSIIVALTLSGLPSHKFLFLGFLDKASAKKQILFKKYQEEDITLIFFESPNRLSTTLKDIVEVFGKDQTVSIARELTKMFEEIISDTAENLHNVYHNNKPKGEIVVLLKPEKICNLNIDEILKEYLNNSTSKSTKEIAKELATKFNLNKSIVYDKIIKIKESQ